MYFPRQNKPDSCHSSHNPPPSLSTSRKFPLQNLSVTDGFLPKKVLFPRVTTIPRPVRLSKESMSAGFSPSFFKASTIAKANGCSDFNSAAYRIPLCSFCHPASCNHPVTTGAPQLQYPFYQVPLYPLSASAPRLPHPLSKYVIRPLYQFLPSMQWE